MRPKSALLALVLVAGSVAAAQPASTPALEAAVKASTRSPANIARDRYRHPVETLSFFGVKPTDTVVEIWPSGGWYTEILAPYLAAHGTLYAAGPDDKGLAPVKSKQSALPAAYRSVRFATVLSV
jgi:predicted methyltransferase